MLDTQTPQLDAAQQVVGDSRCAGRIALVVRENRASRIRRWSDADSASRTAPFSLPVRIRKPTPTQIQAQTDLRKVTGVRLEVLPDPSLPHGGPGRDAEGNFFLSDFDVQVTSPEPQLRTVAWKSALADESQDGYAVKNIVQKKAGSAVGLGHRIGREPKPPGRVRRSSFPMSRLTSRRALR